MNEHKYTFKSEIVSVKNPGDTLSATEQEAIKAFVNGLSPEEGELLMSLIDHDKLIEEIHRRIKKMQFQMDAIKGIVEI